MSPWREWCVGSEACASPLCVCVCIGEKCVCGGGGGGGGEVGGGVGESARKLPGRTIVLTNRDVPFFQSCQPPGSRAQDRDSTGHNDTTVS